MIRHAWLFLLPLLLAPAACGSDDAGDSSPGGSGGDESTCTQTQCRDGETSAWEVDKVCVAGTCMDAGLRDEFNEIRRGAVVMGLSTHDVDARNFASAYVRLFYPRDARGETVDCQRILATPDRIHPDLNVVGYHSTAVRSQGYRDLHTVIGPVAGLPVNDPSTPYLVYVGVFSEDRDATTKHPKGVLLAEGCLGGLVVPDGEPESWSEPSPEYMFNGLKAGPPVTTSEG